MSRARVIVAAAAALLVVVAAPATAGRSVQDTTPAAAPFAEAWASVPASSTQRKARNIVVFGARGVVNGFNTQLACCNQLWVGFSAANEALRGAFNQNEKGTWFKDLVSAASVDKTGLSYTIKPNAYWYWGGKKVPVTYRDFVYTLQQIDDPNNDLVIRSGYSQIDPNAYTHHGDKHVRFFWKTKNCSTDFPCGPYANWQNLFSMLYPSFALTGMDFNKIWMSCICGNNGKPVSDGPFYLSNYTPGQGTTLKANPYYYNKPKVSEVDFRFVLDPSAEEQAMLGGQVDAISPLVSPVLTPLKGAPGITFDQIPGYYFEHLELREGNAKAGPTVTKGASNVLLRAPWLREAIMLGIDRQKIIDAVFGQLAGNTKPLDNMIFYSTQTPYTPDFGRWNYNPPKALAILTKHCDAGSGPAVINPTNTKIWQCAGLPATFNWSWAAGRDDWTTSEQIAKAELKSIGIQIVDRPLSLNLVFGPNGIPTGNFDIVQFREITTGDPGDWYDTYRCEGSGNWTGYCSHKVDSLLNAANGELDPARRARLFQKADALMATQVPMIPMYQLPVPLVHRSDLLGMRQNPGVAGPVWNIEHWHWRSSGLRLGAYRGAVERR
jgi:ABC-type transport system substrate-binding protein